MHFRFKNISSGALFVLLIFFALTTVAQNESIARKEIGAHRKKQFKEFKNKEKSPLTPDDRKKLKSLNYFPIDLKYRVTAKFGRTESEPFFKMKTTTTRLPDYVKYGEVHFNLDGQELKLEVYQSPDVMKMPGYEDYLFIPFSDLTNGEQTYEVGRYLEFRIPKGDEVVILDFNKCYNPYCSYNSKYSCPIPPEPNQLPIAILAGEKKFH
jgi:uncharacterized protein